MPAGCSPTLHQRSAERFGFERDTLHRTVPPRQHLDRVVAGVLRAPAAAADGGDRGRARRACRRRTARRVERLAGSLPERFEAAPTPSLIHGDVWGGNVLARGGRIAAFLDPALYFADAEVELAFIDLFHTFGNAFYEAYEARRPIDAGYRRWRRDLYQVFPLLVHVALFGGAYVDGLRERLRRLGV